MDIRPYIKKASGKLLAAIAGALMLYACDGLIYDGEGDCSVSYRVKFRYDYNMKFAHEVDVVTLYLLDADGRVVWQRTEQGEALAADGYAMIVDVEPGEYGLLAWCGTTDKGSFSIPATTVGKQLTCTLDRQHDAGNKAFVTEDLDRLFHGWLPEQTFGKTEGTYTYTVPLVKNTNNVRVVLQHISGEAVDKDRFVFTITGTNGSMDWDNTLLPDEPVTFYAWHTDAGEADRGNADRISRRLQRGHSRTDRAAPCERSGAAAYRNRQGNGKNGVLHSPYRLCFAGERFL